MQSSGTGDERCARSSAHTTVCHESDRLKSRVEDGLSSLRFLEIFFDHITYVDTTLNEVIPATLHVLPNPLPIIHRVIRLYISPEMEQ